MSMFSTVPVPYLFKKYVRCREKHTVPDLLVLSSVMDPVTFWYGSESADPYHLDTDPDPRIRTT